MTRLFAAGSGSYSNVPGRLAAALVAGLLLFTGQSFGAPAVKAVGPTISTIVPASASAGQTVTINGSGFGASQATGTCIHFQDQNQLNNGPNNWGLFGNAANPGFPSPTSWSDTAITFKVPVPADSNDRRRVRPGSTATVFFHSGGGCAGDGSSGGTDVSSISLPIANSTNIADYFGDESKFRSPAIGISTDYDAGCGDASGAYLSAEALANGLAVTNATYSAGTVTLTLDNGNAAASTLANGSTITVAGVRPTGYNGTFSVTGATGSTVQYALASDPGTFTTRGTVTRTIPITGASWSGGTATLTYASTTFYPSGSGEAASANPSLGYMTVSGVSPSGYNGSFRVLSAGATSLTYALAANPGSYTSGGNALDGIWPGRVLTFNGFTWTWAPSTACVSNAFNNDLWNSGSGGNPTVLFNPRSGVTNIGILGSGVGGSTAIAVTITYTDNSTLGKTMRLEDWCGGAGTDQVIFAQMKYRNTSGNTRQTPVCNLFLDTITGLDNTKTPKSITFANSGTNAGNVRVFGISLNGTPATTTTVTSSQNPSVHGQGVTFTATVASAEGTPTGTVNFKDGVTTISGCGSVSLSGGQATCGPISNLSTASHSITAVYTPADSSFTTSTSSALSQVVNQSTSGTVVTVAPAFNNPSVHGEFVGWKATVSATGSGAGTPSGTVQFKIDGTDFDTPAALVSGVATSVTISSLSTASHSITAFYSGDTDFSASDNTGSAYSQVVNATDTTTTITGVSLGTPTVVGESYTVSWSVVSASPGAGTPTGTVTVTGGSGCSASVAAGSCSFASDAAGPKSLVATYASDSIDFNGSASSGDAHTVNAADTTTTITNDLSMATVVGQSDEVDWSVDVTGPGAGSPTGNVTVSDGSASCFADISAGHCDLTSTTAGPKTITATYAGDDNFNTSASTGTAHTVHAAETSVSVDSDNHPSFHGEAVTFTATVTASAPGGGTPNDGTVEFKDGGVDIIGCTAVALVSGSADCGPFTDLSIGDHFITAIYSGYADYSGSDNIATSFTQTVGKYETTTSVVADYNPSVHGQGVTFTATVSDSVLGTPTGSVDFYDDVTLICDDAPLNGSAEATCGPITGLSTGTHSNITAVYSGDGDFATSTSDAYSQQVNKADTAITIDNATSLASTGSVVGETYTVQWTVSVTGDGTGLPTGYVSVDGGSLGDCYVPVSDGECSFASHDAGPKTLVATYSGDDDFNGSFSAGASHTVNAADTTTALTSDINPSVHSQAVTYTATVAVTAPGDATPTGTVDFYADANLLCSDVALDISLQATCGPLSDLPTATNSMTAVYSGDADTNTSTSDAYSQIINPADTTASVTSDINPSAVGEGVTFTVTVVAVSPASATPDGTVDVWDGATLFCNDAPLDVSGQATCGPVSDMAPGLHSITAIYSGSTDFNGDTSDAYSQNVNQYDTTTTVTSDVNPSVHGQGVTFTATVSADSGTPTGSVDFFDGATLICDDAALDGNAEATCGPITNLTTTSHSITAHYNGDTSYAESTSNSYSQVVNTAGTTTSVVADINPSVFGQAVTFTATVAAVSPGAGIPTGTVEFWDGLTDLGPGTLDGSGMADSAPISSLSVASHDITAVYAGDTNFSGSDNDAAPYSQVVNTAGTTTSVVADINPSVFGQAVTFTATVAAVSPGAGIPTGTVEFWDGLTDLGPGTLDGSGMADSAPISSLSVASHDITAVYAGGTNFSGSDNDAAPYSQVVNTADSTVSITNGLALATASVVGESYTVAWSVDAAAPGAGTPTGTVTVSGGSGCLNVPVATGQCSFASDTAGLKSLIATYSGDANFNGSVSSGVSHYVGAADTTTGLVSNINPSVHGQAVTFTATIAAVAPGAGTPTGTVTFYDGVTAICTNVALSGVSADCVISTLSTATHSITATYNGDANFNTSTSTALSQVVHTATTTTTLSSSVNPSVHGQGVVFTATVVAVAPGVGVPTGMVQFKKGTTNLGSPVALNGSGQASTPIITTLKTGTRNITAVYLGSSNFLGSTSPVLHQVVNKAATTATIWSSPNPSTFSHSFTLHATVLVFGPGAGTVGGKVQFYVDGHKLYGPVKLHSGQANLVVNIALTLGNHTIKAVYLGNANFLGDSSANYNHHVNP